ncbi:hypothetical protein NW767_010610 [Fusarium falciforme]|nr:hypothetical protein NW767_010610 [Fusarium falciforme]
MPGFDDHAWSKAKGLLDDNPMPDFSILPWNLFPRSIPALTYIPKRFKGVVKVIKVSGVSPQKALEEWNSLLIRGKPVTIPANSKVLLDIQAAEYTTGYLTFTFDNGAGAHVGHLSAESYELEPRDREITRKKGNRVDFQNGHLNGVWDEYVVAGRQSEVYETFWFRAFRFLRVKVITKAESLIISDISYKETNYPLDVRAKFKAQSSPMKQQFWDISLRTLKNCMHETYEDCPYYEQSQFLFDTRTQILLTYIVSGDDRLARKALLDFHSSLRPHGLIAMRYPAHTNLSLPGFSLFFPMMVHDHIMYKGDVSLAKRFFPTIDTILGYYDRQLTEQGLIGPLDRRFWSFVDWVDDWEWGVPPASKVGPVTYFSLVYAMALEYSAEVAKFIGRDGLGTEYLYRKAAVISAINAHCFDGTWYYDGPIDTFSESPVDWRSQHCQIYAVLSGAIEGNEARDLINRALDDKAVHEVTLSQAFYLFRALEKTGLYEKRQDYWGSWEAMVAEGLDTWAETLVSPRSDCHAWSAVPLYELSTMILGVNPAHPGFAVADVKPLPALLKEVDSKIVTPSGMLHIRWAPADPPVDNNQESGTRRVYLKIDGPPGLQVNLYKPGDSESVVTFKGHFEGDYWLT